jgi:hypothetical protein
MTFWVRSSSEGTVVFMKTAAMQLYLGIWSSYDKSIIVTTLFSGTMCMAPNS